MFKRLFFIVIFLHNSLIYGYELRIKFEHITTKGGLSHKAAMNTTQLYIKKIISDFVRALGFQIKEANSNLLITENVKFY